MSDKFFQQFTEYGDTRLEVAIAAARLIVEDGLDYGTAKQKAVKQLFGTEKVKGKMLPDNAMIEEEVRQYHEIFYEESQPARLLHMRNLAIELMTWLDEYHPYLVGAVLNGTASVHSDIRLQLFVDNAKEVAIFLLNKQVSFDLTETTHFKKRGDVVETLSFLWKNEGVHLMIYPHDDLRGALKRKTGEQTERANLNEVKRLIMEEM